MLTIWQNRDNTLDFALELDGVPLDAPAVLDSTNKLYLLLKDSNNLETVFSSLANPAYFSIDQRYVNGNLLRTFAIALGSAALAEGEYSGVLTLYDSVHLSGVVIAEFRVQVRDAT